MSQFFCNKYGNMAMTPLFEDERTHRQPAKERTLAVVRILLGTGQIMGAIFALIGRTSLKEY